MTRGRSSAPAAATERVTRGAATRKAAGLGPGGLSAKPAVTASDVSSSSSDDENQPPPTTAASKRAPRLTRQQTAVPAKGQKPRSVNLDESSDSEECSSGDEIYVRPSTARGQQQQHAAPQRGAAAARGGARRFAVSRRSKVTGASGPAVDAKPQPAAAVEPDVPSDDGSESSGSVDEEAEAAGPSTRRAGRPAASGRKRSALALLAGKLDEELLKRMARDRPDSINFNLKDALMRRLQACGHKWRFHLRCGHSMLLYGFGSKRALLDQWARQVLTDGAAVTVNGFNPAVTAKQVALAAAAVLLPGSMRGSSAADIVAAIRNHQPVGPEQHVYIILHNIDGPGLRDPEEQALLAELASCPTVHLAASIDHINAPLMWDVKTMALFRWVYQDATTFAPYFAETMDMQPVLLSCFKETTQRGASTALGSMPPAAQAVFRVLAEAQLDDPSAPGLTFATLFRMCRERWLVSNEQALRGFLAEFTDHELVAERMAALNGEEREVLYVPMEEEVLKKLVEANAS